MARARIHHGHQVNLADLLLDTPEWASPDDVLVHAGDRTVTRAELTELAVGVRDRVRDAGVEPGMPVAMMGENTPETIATLFGVWAAGAVYVPVNPRTTPDERARLFESVPPALVLETAGGATDPPRSPDREVKTYDGDVALVQMTSGTTGPPKPVLLTHAAVLSLIDAVLEKVRGSKLTKKSSTVNLLPVSLSLWAGIYNTVFAFRVGAPVVLMEKFEPREFASLVDKHGIRSVVLPPAAIAMLCDDDELTSLAPLEWVRSITAPLSPFLARRFHQRFGIGVLNSYGQTELGGEIVGWNAADWREWSDMKLGAVGRPHAGVEVRTLRDDGSLADGDDTGELVVRTPSLSAGYADGSALNVDRATVEGWFRTGDLGRVDADGFVWIDGRVSDQINRGGMKVTPSEVEEVLVAAPGVREAAVVAASDERLGEIPVAFVVPVDPSAVPDAAALEEHCRAHLSPWKVPVRFHALDTLPRNEVGKVLKRELAEPDRA